MYLFVVIEVFCLVCGLVGRMWRWLRLVVWCIVLIGFRLLLLFCNVVIVVVSCNVLGVDKLVIEVLNNSCESSLFFGSVGVLVKLILGFNV